MGCGHTGEVRRLSLLFGPPLSLPSFLKACDCSLLVQAPCAMAPRLLPYCLLQDSTSCSVPIYEHVQEGARMQNRLLVHDTTHVRSSCLSVRKLVQQTENNAIQKLEVKRYQETQHVRRKRTCLASLI